MGLEKTLIRVWHGLYAQTWAQVLFHHFILEIYRILFFPYFLLISFVFDYGHTNIEDIWNRMNGVFQGHLWNWEGFQSLYDVKGLNDGVLRAL